MLDVLRNNIKTLISAIEDCRDRKQTLPCLTLIYCGIDIVASLERSKNEGTASAFQRWTNNYLLSGKYFGCSSKDLYGARCGVVHTSHQHPTIREPVRLGRLFMLGGKQVWLIFRQ